MDNQTALWLLSVLIQSMATIWALFMFIYFFFLKRMIEEEKFRMGDFYFNLIMMIFNITIVLAIFSGILGLLNFRNDFWIALTVSLSMLSIILIGTFTSIITLATTLISAEEAKKEEGKKEGGKNKIKRKNNH